MPAKPTIDNARLDRVVAEARRAAEQRLLGYRERALKMYPWVCGRCAREFTRANVQELTVHHRNHDHDCNPADGSNWELLCVYCHDNDTPGTSTTCAAACWRCRTRRPPPATRSPI